MGLFRYWYLAREFLHPQSLGAYYDGEFHASGVWPKTPARLYLAISHGELYFQHLRLPPAVPADKVPQALALEARRFLAQLKGQEERVSLAFLRLAEGQFLVAFREHSFFQRLERQLPSPLVPCGFFPAWVALLAWFWPQGPLKDGLYFVRTKKGIEGFLWQEGRLTGVLPFSRRAAESLIAERKETAFEAPEERAEEVLAEGASKVALLPEDLRVTFEGYPLLLRPKISKKALLLWVLPLLFLGVGMGFQHQTEILKEKEQAIAARVKKLRQKEALLRQRLEEQKLLEELAQEVRSYQKRPKLLAALAELAKLLPEDTWIRKFEFRYPNVIQLWGESQNTLEVVKRLEASPLFREVKVLSSVTKNPRTGKENFAIRAYLETP